MRTSNLTKEDEATIMRMFIGYKLQKSIQNPNLYVNEFVLANYALKVPDDYLIHRNFSINTRYRVGSLVGFIFNRKEGVLIMLHNGRKILQLDHVPCECPLEWFPAFSVGPYNQITLCQDISFDVHKIISQDLEKDPNQKTDNNNFNCTVKPVFMFGRS